MRKIFSVFLFLVLIACEEEGTPRLEEKYVTIDNFTFGTKSADALIRHPLLLDTSQPSYTLKGYGAFKGKSKSIQFSSGGLYRGVPTVRLSGWDALGDTYLACDTAGNIVELYRRKVGSVSGLHASPLTMFASKHLALTDTWQAFSGWDRERNTQHFVFQTRVLSKKAATATGIHGCIQLEYRTPDYVDTVYFQIGKGPIEIRSWRKKLLETHQPAFGGYTLVP